MSQRTISIYPSSTFLTYSNLYLVFISRRNSVCMRLLDIRSNFNSMQSADKQVDVTGVSTVSFTDSFPQILRSLQRSSLPIQLSFRPNTVWCVWYKSLSRSWYTDFDYDSYRLPDLELGLTTGVTDQQGMFTSPRYLT
jgi:hypothetical protein